MAGTVWFDFDGTLAYRPSMWAEACLELLDDLVTCHELTHAGVEAALGTGMPWHRPDLCHEDLNDPERWWQAVASRTQEALTELGTTVCRDAIAVALRRSITDAGRYRLFDDTVAAMELVGARGWRAAVVSNHIPELDELCEGLGIRRNVDWVLTSASVGFEKPHGAIFEMALARTHVHPVWMVGDNVDADCQPVARHGIRAMLVRHDDDRFEPRKDTLIAAVEEICSPS